MAAQELLDIADGLASNGLLTHTHLLSGVSTNTETRLALTRRNQPSSLLHCATPWAELSCSHSAR